jgi:hypothetical protein
MPPTPKIVGTTADGWPIYRIAGKEYFLKNGKFYNISNNQPEANASIQAFVHSIIAKDIVKSTPDLLKKPVNEIESLVRELLIMKAQLEVAHNSWNIVLFAKKVAQRVRVILAAKKLRILGRRRVSVDVGNNTHEIFEKYDHKNTYTLA